ncbi:hypothetical protein ACFX16_030712 [Malus domestica]
MLPVPASTSVRSHRGDLAKIPTAVDERQGEDLALVNVVHADGFKDLGLDEMADADFGHDGDGDGALDFLDELGVGHSGYAALGSDVGGDVLESHDSVGLPSNASVFPGPLM